MHALLATILEAADGLEARHVGLYALNSLRLEKGFGIWSREFSRDFTPHEAGLGRFLDYAREGFVGREAALRDRDSSPRRRLVTLSVDSHDADASGYEPITVGKELVGFVTSGGYGHCAGSSLAMGYVDSAVTAATGVLSVTILGEARTCRILEQPLIDPSGARLRS
jgi:dimethylglycine dehydrogenase